MKDYRQKITTFAKSQGFDLVGFTKAKVAPKYIKAYKNWLKNDCHASMQYMEKSSPRLDLTKILPNAKFVIVLGMNYYRPQPPLKEGNGRISRYAYGRDYHKIITKKLKKVENFIKELSLKTQTKSYIDTGPILEKALAEQAVLGTIGKNSCLITKDFGSWIFLAEIITTLDLTSDTFSIPSHKGDFHLCGNCTRCIDACPTGAIIAPGVIDARLCISYQTIENKGKIPPDLAKKIKKTKYLFGCDICQEVCPHNIAKQKPTSHKSLTSPKIAGDQLPFKKILSIKTDQKFLKIFAGSPLMRPKLKGLNRNAKDF